MWTHEGTAEYEARINASEGAGEKGDDGLTRGRAVDGPCYGVAQRILPASEGEPTWNSREQHSLSGKAMAKPTEPGLVLEGKMMPGGS